MSAIFINSIESRCGVHQYGLRLYNSIKDRLLIDYATVGTLEEYLEAIKGYEKVVINYYCSLFHFLNKSNQDESIKYFYIDHTDIFYDIRPGTLINNDPNHKNGIPRPLVFNDTTNYPPPNLNNPVIGSFGFGFLNKQFDKVIEIVQMEFDNATIRLLIPGAFWGDPNGDEARMTAERCRQRIRKQGIKLQVCHDFLPDEEVFKFLEGNDLNLFMYPQYNNKGCSSAPDYALGVNRPIAISDSDMFRHIYDDSICAYKTRLRTIMENGPVVNKKFRELWSKDAMVSSIQKRLDLQYRE
jgi:hypothetical protein